MYHATGFVKDDIVELCSLVHGVGLSAGNDSCPVAWVHRGQQMIKPSPQGRVLSSSPTLWVPRIGTPALTWAFA